jgi:hypothetical protein
MHAWPFMSQLGRHRGLSMRGSHQFESIPGPAIIKDCLEKKLENRVFGEPDFCRLLSLVHGGGLGQSSHPGFVRYPHAMCTERLCSVFRTNQKFPRLKYILCVKVHLCSMQSSAFGRAGRIVMPSLQRSRWFRYSVMSVEAETGARGGDNILDIP